MPISGEYLSAIQKFEGFTQKASWDYAQFTNGYGTKARFAGETIDKVEAERRFNVEIQKAKTLVEKFAPHVDEGTKSALTSLTFNAGTAWMRSGLGDAVSRGDLDRAREVFVQYNKAGGKVLPGLVARREAEVLWIGQASLSRPSYVFAAPNKVAFEGREERGGGASSRASVPAPAIAGVSSPEVLARLTLDVLDVLSRTVTDESGEPEPPPQQQVGSQFV